MKEEKKYDQDEQTSEYDEVVTPVQARQKKKKKRRKKRYILKFFILCVLIVGVIFVMHLNYFNIDSIEIKGNKYVEAEQVIKDAGIKVGDNIFFFNKRKIKSSLEEKENLKDIEIDRQLPNKLVITIAERDPAIAVSYGGKFVILDKNGIVMGLSESNPKLTNISNITIKSMDRAEKLLAKNEEVFEKTLTLINEMENADLFFKAVQVKDDETVCYIYDKLVVKDDYDTILENIKNGNLKSIISELYEKSIKRGTIRFDDEKYASFSPIYE